MKNLHTRKTSNGSNSDWLIRQMSINQKSGWQTFRTRFVSGSLFVSPFPLECNFQSETKIEPDLRLSYKTPVNLVYLDVDFGLQHFKLCLFVTEGDEETNS